MTDKKKFGLIMPKSDAFKAIKNPIFDDDSDEDERIHKRPKIPQKTMESKSKLKTCFVEDPSIYEYDGIYDEMKRQQKETISPKEKKNSRYIGTLLSAAEKRKKEYERRIDKKIQAEREKEGDKFKDKEAFVTSSYKKKMLQQEEEEQKEIRENMLNDMMDVTKQKDLSGFYRHFLKQTVGEEKIPQFGEEKVKEQLINDEDFLHNLKSSEKYKNIDQDSVSAEIKDSEIQNNNKKSQMKLVGVSTEKESQNTKQTYDSDEPKTLQFHNKKHCRKPSSTESEEDNSSADKSCQSDNKSSDKHNLTNLCNVRHDSCSSLDENDQVNEKTANADANYIKNINEKNCNLYKKHTVGEIFAEAQARYFQRMTTQKIDVI